ncbi:hypothetical protein EMCRGX_G023539 [Ephydatia muelleri]
MAKGVSRSKENPTNGATVQESDPLRAPVCRKGKLIGEVSTNWKALCQQLKLKSTEESKDEAKDAHELKVPEVSGGKVEVSRGKTEVSGGKTEVSGGKAEVSGGKAEVSGGKTEVSGGKAEVSGGKAEVSGGKAEDHAPPDKRKFKLQKKRVERKRKQDKEAGSGCIEEDAKTNVQRGTFLEGDEDGLGTVKKRSKIKSTGIDEQTAEGVGEGKNGPTDTDVPKPKLLKKREKKENEVSILETGVTQIDDVDDIVKQGVQRRSKVTTKCPKESKDNPTQVTETNAKRTKRSRISKDTEGEQEEATHIWKSSKEAACAGKSLKELVHAGKSPGNPPNEVTSTGENVDVMRSLVGKYKAMNEQMVATESVPNVRKKQFEDVDANLKLLKDSGDLFSKKRDTSNLGKRDHEAVMGSMSKKPADFWFDDVDLSDVGKTKRPRTSLLISGQDMSVGKCVALDCEMVGIGPDGYQSMLARCSVVNHHGNVIYDSFVAPMETVTDYRTRYSGVRQEDLEDAPSFKIVQKKVSDLLKGRILVGHGLKHDLKALLLSHPKKDTRDTVSYKPFRALSQGKTPPLKKLSSELLGVNIQEGEHNSIEDAQAAMRLYQKHKAEWEAHLKKRERFRSGKRTTFGPGAQKPVKASQKLCRVSIKPVLL